jgi:hypothetical protein
MIPHSSSRDRQGAFVANNGNPERFLTVVIKWTCPLFVIGERGSHADGTRGGVKRRHHVTGDHIGNRDDGNENSLLPLFAPVQFLFFDCGQTPDYEKK